MSDDEDLKPKLKISEWSKRKRWLFKWLPDVKSVWRPSEAYVEAQQRLDDQSSIFMKDEEPLETMNDNVLYEVSDFSGNFQRAGEQSESEIEPTVLGEVEDEAEAEADLEEVEASDDTVQPDANNTIEAPSELHAYEEFDEFDDCDAIEYDMDLDDDLGLDGADCDEVEAEEVSEAEVDAEEVSEAEAEVDAEEVLEGSSEVEVVSEAELVNNDANTEVVNEVVNNEEAPQSYDPEKSDFSAFSETGFEAYEPTDQFDPNVTKEFPVPENSFKFKAVNVGFDFGVRRDPSSTPSNEPINEPIEPTEPIEPVNEPTEQEPPTNEHNETHDFNETTQSINPNDSQWNLFNVGFTVAPSEPSFVEKEPDLEPTNTVFDEEVRLQAMLAHRVLAGSALFGGKAVKRKAPAYSEDQDELEAVESISTAKKLFSQSSLFGGAKRAKVDRRRKKKARF